MLFLLTGNVQNPATTSSSVTTDSGMYWGLLHKQYPYSGNGIAKYSWKRQANARAARIFFSLFCVLGRTQTVTVRTGRELQTDVTITRDSDIDGLSIWNWWSGSGRNACHVNMQLRKVNRIKIMVPYFWNTL